MRQPAPVSAVHAAAMTASQRVAWNMTRLRVEAGMTQTELGRRLGGWSTASVSAAERSAAGGRIRKFDADELALMAHIFGVGVSELLEPPELCGTCQGAPPAGMKCMSCGLEAPQPIPEESAR